MSNGAKNVTARRIRARQASTNQMPRLAIWNYMLQSDMDRQWIRAGDRVYFTRDFDGNWRADSKDGKRVFMTDQEARSDNDNLLRNKLRELDAKPALRAKDPPIPV